MIQNNIDASLAGDSPYFAYNGLASMIDHFIGSKGSRFFKLLVSASHRNNSGPEELCHLNGRAPHSGPRADHQNIFSRSDARASDQHMPGCEENQGYSGGFVKTQIARDGQDIYLRRSNIFSVAAINQNAKQRVTPTSAVQPLKALRTMPATDSRA